MKKDTIRYFVQEKCCSGYSYLIQPTQLAQEAVLDFLVQWSEGKNILIYSHALRKQEENFDAYKDQYHVPQPFGGTDPATKDVIMGRIKVPFCDWVYYLDIWYQEKNKAL